MSWINNRLIRRLHRWGAVITLIPLSLVIVTGLLLQVKKQVAWVQPPTMRGAGTVPEIGWDEILSAAQQEPHAAIEDWSDIDRLDIQPAKGIVKIRSNNRWEIQQDLQTGEVLSSVYRRSDLIESLHDGSWFSDRTKLWVFLPNGLILLALLCTGAWLWLLPYRSKWNKKRRIKARQRTAAGGGS